jgi:hypothetical protein
MKLVFFHSQKFGPGRGISPSLVKLLRDRGVEVFDESSDHSLFTDVISTLFCGFSS